MISKFRILLSAAVFLFISGCGYTTSSLLPASYKTIYVAPFKNNISYTTERTRNIYFPLIEVDAHRAIVDRFLFDGNLRIAKEHNADLILKGELTKYERIGLRFNADDERDVEEYRAQVTVSLVLIDAKTQEVVWEEPSFVGEATYFTTGSQARSEKTAVDEALLDLARRVVERTIEDW